MIDHDAIGTHDVQEIKMINQSCFYIDIINGSEITEFHIQIVSSREENYKLNVPRQNVTLCSPIVYNGTHNIHFSEGSGLYVYDDQTEEKNGQPADGISNLKVLVTTTAEPAPSSSSGKYKTLSDCYRYTFSFYRNCGSTCLFFSGGSIGLNANVMLYNEKL